MAIFDIYTLKFPKNPPFWGPVFTGPKTALTWGPHTRTVVRKCFKGDEASH